jgi:nitroimidazol reductase NimA-like FMN-containing flavoprotein (pyridoxamine 5'-phosphate oxidase superfamily)
MVIREMTEQECYAMLAGTSLARLACARNNQPYIVPLRVDFRGGALYGYATLGQKIEWMRQNPRVCLEFDDLIDEEQWTSVVVFGYFEELPSTPDHADSRAIAQALFQRRPGWWEPASVRVGEHVGRAPIVFRIQITRVSGRRACPDPKRMTNALTDVPGSSKPGWVARMLGPLARRHQKTQAVASPRDGCDAVVIESGLHRVINR